MKKFALLFAIVLAIASISAFAEPMLGGWTVCEDAAVTDEAKAALEKALENFVGSNIEPVALLGTQVVAGTNYCLLCKLTNVVPDAVPYYAIVFVYQGVDGTAEILSISPIDPGAMLAAAQLDEEA